MPGIPRPSEQPRIGAGRILLIDDSPTVIEVLKVYLMGAGYEFLVARSGDQGFDLAKRERPDVIVSDVRMPGLSGLDLVGALRATGAFDRTPVILISSKWTRESRRAAATAGVAACLEKPVAPDELARLVESLVPR